jgi:3-hydroxybutyryl-CoA dehydrogenase
VVKEERLMYVERAAVVGAGTMGADIAYCFCLAGVPVVLRDVSQDQLTRARRHIEGLMERRVQRGRLNADEARRRLELVTLTDDSGMLREVDLAIEAVPERLDIKRAVLEELDRWLPPLSILASNTSALSITELAKGTGRPGQVAGFHFFFPAHTMRLIEVVAGQETTVETVDSLVRVADEIRKFPVRVRECPGFLVNRVLMRGLAEVFRYQEDTGATPDRIDRAVEAAHAAPMGPYRLADALGLDVVAEVARTLTEAYGPRFAPGEMLLTQVQAGRLGVKTGTGFYEYGGATPS